MDFSNRLERHEHVANELLEGKVALLLMDTPHYVIHKCDMDSSSYDVFTSEDMTKLVELEAEKYCFRDSMNIC